MTRLNEIANILNGIVDRGNTEMREMERAGLEQYWHFAWNASASLEWNLYEFHKMLRLYGSFCRRWEEMHNDLAPEKRIPCRASIHARRTT